MSDEPDDVELDDELDGELDEELGEELDGDLDGELDPGLDGEVDGVLPEGDEADESDDDAVPTARRKRTEDVEDDEDEPDDDDVEADLDTILKDRIAAGDDEDEDEEAPEEPTGEAAERVAPRSGDEFACTTCFLIVHPRQFGRPGSYRCPEGYDPCSAIDELERRASKPAKRPAAKGGGSGSTSKRPASKRSASKRSSSG
ncbi:MAG: hypothetical protein ACOYOQ_12285 [Microthrixaceae bacterium]|jgi:hypothetical protein